MNFDDPTPNKSTSLILAPKLRRRRLCNERRLCGRQHRFGRSDRMPTRIKVCVHPLGHRQPVQPPHVCPPPATGAAAAGGTATWRGSATTPTPPATAATTASIGTASDRSYGRGRGRHDHRNMVSGGRGIDGRRYSNSGGSGPRMRPPSRPTYKELEGEQG